MNCVLIGNTSLLVACAEILLESRVEILGIVSEDPSVSRWARANGIATGGEISWIQEEVGGFDFLFSIVNERKITESVLTLPRVMAINYHNAPLPRYAGSNATSWAILNEEHCWGVTWHLMSSLIDGGGILDQREFECRSDETALTLNMKCFEAATASFRSLVYGLINDCYKISVQDLKERTFYSRAKKTLDMGFISWRHSYREMDRLVRACDFGRYTNEFLSSKVLIGEQFYIVKDLVVVGNVVNEEPGEIVAISDEGLVVACQDALVSIRSMVHICGEECSIDSIVRKHKLAVKDRLKNFSEDAPTLADAKRLSERVANNEKKWIHRMRDMQNIDNADTCWNAVSSISPKAILAPLRIPEGFVRDDRLKSNEFSSEAMVIACFLLGVAFVSHSQSVLFCFAMDGGSYGSKVLFHNFLPCKMVLSKKDRFVDCVERLRCDILEAVALGPFLKDIFVRHREASLPEIAESGLLSDVRVRQIENISECWQERSHEGGLELVLEENAQRAFVRWDESMYCHEKVQDIVNLSKLIMEKLLGAIGTPLGELMVAASLRNTSERSIVHGVSIPLPSRESLISMFEKRLEQSSGNICLIEGSQALTYTDLDRRVDCFAKELFNMGVIPQSIVACVMDRGVEHVTLLLSIIKLGAIYMPIDENYPFERIKWMLEDSGAEFVVVSRSEVSNKFMTSLLGSGQFFRKQDLGDSLFGFSHSSESRSHKVRVDQSWKNRAAYLIYTSGTAGPPKGVLGHEAGIINRIKWMWNCFPYEAGETCCQKTSISFIDSLAEIFAPLLKGVPLVVVSSALTRDLDRFVGVLSRHRVTRLVVVPSLLGALLSSFDDLAEELPDLNFWVTSGEELTGNLARKFFERKPKGRLINLYGCSECSADSLYYEVSRSDGVLSVPIGRPIANTTIILVASNEEPVHVGERGEIWIGGAGVSFGYCDELLSQDNSRFVFRNNGYMGKERYYRTGDWGCLRSDGEIEYLGRTDNQVKIRGCRINLLEIEKLVSSIAEIESAIVVPCAHWLECSIKKLCCFFVNKKGEQVNISAIIEFLTSKLPLFALPDEYFPLGKMPLTSNGKVDRKALIEHREKNLKSQVSGTVAFQSLHDEIGLKLLDLYQKKFKRREVDVDANFTDLGMDSLSLMIFRTEISHAFKLDCTFNTLACYSSLRKMAEYLRSQLMTDTEAPNSGLRKRKVFSAKLRQIKHKR